MYEVGTACVCVFRPGLQLLGHSLGFVPFMALNENVDRLFDEVHVQVKLSSLQRKKTTRQ